MQNFYEHQEVAEHNSTSLIFMMCGAIAGTILVTGLILTAVTFGLWYAVYLNYEGTRYESRIGGYRHRVVSRRAKPSSEEFPLGLALFWYGTLTTATGAGVISVTWAKVKSLRKGGGEAVAAELGGVRLGRGQDNPHHYRGDLPVERALNVVEEMAIAARLRPPTVFLLAGQDGINAFVVGYTKDDVVLGLTEGAVRKLSREQLQGVIAHEFAHIFNGDMRLNLQMIGYMHGILGIAMVAQWSLQIGAELLNDVDNRQDVGLGLLLILLGALLWPVGMIGNGFASLIKAAFSRQREFLADAYAVQFTRNAEGVADALKRIAGDGRGGLVRHARSVQCSHLFFANGCKSLSNLFRSHPPLEKRILRIDPHWDGRPLFETEDELQEVHGAFEGAMNFLGGSLGGSDGPDKESDGPSISAAADESVLETFCPHDQSTLAYVDQLKASIGPAIWQISRESPGAEVLLLALWFAADDNDEAMAKLAPALRPAVEGMQRPVQRLDAAQRLLLLDSAVESLEKAPASDFQRFVQACQILEAAAARTCGFHWAWWQMVHRVMRARANEKSHPRYGTLEPVLGPCEVALSTLARACGSETMAGFGLQRAITQLGHELTLRDVADCDFATLDMALEKLAELSPRRRREVLLACAACISSDSEVNDEEAYLVRGICSALDYPAVSILPGQPVAPGA